MNVYFIGVLESDPVEYLQRGVGKDPAAIDAVIEQRIAAKHDRDFALADQLRDQLLDQGIILEDSPQGTLWRRK